MGKKFGLLGYIVAIAAGGALLAGCAPQVKTLYQWEGYQP